MPRAGSSRSIARRIQPRNFKAGLSVQVFCNAKEHLYVKLVASSPYSGRSSFTLTNINPSLCELFKSCALFLRSSNRIFLVIRKIVELEKQCKALNHL